VLIGIFISFLGKKLLKPTLFLIGFTISLLFLMLILFNIIVNDDGSTESWIKWSLLIVTFIVSLIIGYILFKLEKYGIFVLGAFLGFIAGNLLYLTLVVRFY